MPTTYFYKNKFFLLISVFIFSVNAVLADNNESHSEQLIRVGVFPNPPVAFKNEDGQWSGISIDVLQAIANKRGWKLNFIEGSFSELLKKAEKNQVDIFSMMAFSEARAKTYSFSRNPLISNWGLVYTRTDAKIASLLDLEGKRVGVMKNNIHDSAFRELTKKFNLNLTVVELANFRDVMENIQKRNIDAGVVNRLFGALNASKYNLVETGIIFNPINIHYSALNPDNRALLDIIDQQLIEFKSDKNSVYFTSLRRWLNNAENSQSYLWLIWLATGLFSVIIVMSGLTLLLRRQVAIRTNELQTEVNERREAERKLDELAYYDSLTKLPNRISLLQNLGNAIERAKRRNNKVAVLFIDIDRFKTVNDSLGHDAGDQLIVHVANRLQTCLREEDSISRFGGDEFVAILQDINELSRISNITERMLKCFDTPVDISSTEIFSSICIGVALYPDDDNGEHLLKYADAAMYHAKEQGGNNYQFYNEKLTQQIQQRLNMETRLRHALEREEFVLFYQPIFSLKDQSIIGVEALIRWNDPEHGLIMPDSFIPLAEETGLIVAIGDWVLKHACLQAKKWEAEGFGSLHLAINVASLQFEHDRLYWSVVSTLKDSGFPAQQLELEITERMFLNISGTVRETLDKLTAKGVKLSIDDFGTGYSSLSYLKQLPINTLKIDRSFIMGIPGDKDDVQITATIITMAHGLNMDVVAEGIETEYQLEYLNSLGCGRGQGYYLSKPLSVEDITSLLKTRLNG